MTGPSNAGNPRMPRYLQALDPRRSLATAVAWFAVVLSLAIALALLGVGNFAVNSMLEQRDAQMMRFADVLSRTLETRAPACCCWVSSTRCSLPSPMPPSSRATCR